MSYLAGHPLSEFSPSSAQNARVQPECTKSTSKKLSRCPYLFLRRDGSAHRDDEVTEKVECRVVEDVRFRLEHLDKQLELVHLGFWQRRHLAPMRVRVGVHGLRHTDFWHRGHWRAIRTSNVSRVWGKSMEVSGKQQQRLRGSCCRDGVNCGQLNYNFSSRRSL